MTSPTAQSTRGRIAGFALIVATAALLYADAPASGRQRASAPAPIEIQAKTISHFESRDTSRRLFGQLQFRGGVELKSSAKNFGGLSSIRVEPDGERFLAISDKGQWLRGRIVYRDDAPSGVADAEMAPMLGPDGQPITARGWYDSESLATDGATAYVGLERVHQILKFDMTRAGLTAAGSPIPVPPEMKKLPANKGIEGLVVGPRGTPLAGTLMAISERGLDEAGNTRGFLIGGATPGLFSIKRFDDDFDLTDAAVTPRGDLLVLERRFSLLRGPGMRIRRIPLAAVKPGALVDGPVLFEADGGFQIDNMEGLSVHNGPHGEVVLTIISDDNFFMLQRTLLLQFTLVEP